MTFKDALKSLEIPVKPLKRMNTYLIHIPEQTIETSALTMEMAIDIAFYNVQAEFDKTTKKET